jgi:hypothetical protein
MGILFSSPYWVLTSSIIVIMSIVFWLYALWFVRQKIPLETLKKNHDVAGYTFSIVGILYSVILGFNVVSVQERYNKTIETLHTEATIVADLYREAGFFPKKSREKGRDTLRQYVHYVIDEEWHLPKEKKMHIEAQKILRDLWDSYYDVQVENENQKIWYQESVSKLDDLMGARLEREFNSWDRLGSMMWSLLLSGAVITIVFMFFFGLDNLRSQMLMTALLAGYLAFILFLIFSLDHTFKGPDSSKPIALEQLSSLFDNWDQ